MAMADPATVEEQPIPCFSSTKQGRAVLWCSASRCTWCGCLGSDAAGCFCGLWAWSLGRAGGACGLLHGVRCAL